MKFRTRTRRVSRPRKKAVWVNIPFGGVAYSEVLGNQVLLVPEDWEASFTGLTIEQATLRAVVGQIVLAQSAAGTIGTPLFWGIYINGANETAVPAFTTSGMSEVDWLRTGCRATASSVSSSVTTTTFMGTEDIAIKAKRKLRSRDQISICAQFGADAASPAGVLSGILRFLIARD